ncbi:restriction endonuclease subunit S [Pseudomonas sp. WS 5414]|uniref:restriction endonuclease subunit S n=1 Tax=Pseudomonas TaxID=286 RepID=UPI001474CAE4|nr:restriction endonuclease subunit S [Pseudomonas sp. WS 5414]NMY72387.1 restriction endonuclease subunit S [Pseudomonas sp. WS 5414]
MSFSAYPEYKDSGVDWLGAIPKGWSIKPLWALFRRHKLTGFPNEQLLSVYRDYGVIPKASRDDNFNKPSDDLGAYQLVQAGDLAINKMKAWQGSVGISIYKGIVSPAYHVYAPNHSEAPQYLHHLFRCNEYIAGYLANSKGIRVNQWDLEPQQHSRMSVLLPPFQEQTQIASFLDHETARIDALIEEQQRLIELLKEKRQAVISHAVTKGLEPTVPMKDSGVEWLGEVPAHWAIKRLKQLVLDAAGIQMGPFGGMLVDLDDSDTGYKVYGQENTISGDFSSGNRWVPESRYVALSNYHLEVGDIVLTRKGSLGNCRRISLLPQAGIIDSDTIRVRVQSQIINPDYLELLLHEAGYISTQLSLVKRGAILSGLNSEIIANLVIVVPPPEGQEELLLEIKAASSRFDQGISDCEYAVGLLRERRSALISAAVTGKIDVRGWQPPASATSPELAQEAV